MTYQRRVFKRYFTEAQEQQLFKYLGSLGDIYARRDLNWMILMRVTGIRVNSMSGLTVADAKAAIKTKHLVLSDEFAKRGKGYTVFIPERGLKALRQLLSIRRELGHDDDPDMPLVMSRSKGRRLSVRSYQDRMKHWVKEAGIDEDASPHWLRHTFAKRIIKNSTAGEPMRIVQSALGHSSLSSTAVYTYPDKEELEESIEAAS